MHTELVACPVAGKGRGVIAQRQFLAGEVIESAPVLVLPNEEHEYLERTILRDYYFAWGENSVAMPLGLSVLYNHSDSPNATAIRHIDRGEIEFIALRVITSGEEITHRYACPPWFSVKDP